MFKKTSVAAFLSITLCVTNASAEDSYNYGIVGFGLSSITMSANTSQGLGANIGAGRKFNNYIGIEAQLNAMGSSSSPEVTALPLSASIIGYIPVKEKMNLFGKAGVAYTTVSIGGAANSVSQSGTTTLWGIGIEAIAEGGQSFRFGLDHYDLSVIPGTSMSTNYFSLTGTVKY